MRSKRLFLASSVLFVLVTLLFIGSVGASSEMWSQTYGGAGSEAAYALVETPDGGYALGGDTNSFGLKWETEGWLVKTDANGNVQWNKTYSRSIRSLIVTSDGGYALTGSGLFVKTDAYGNVEWNRTYSGVSLIETSDGGFALAGSKNDDFSIVKIDASGNREWNRTYGGPEVERAHSLVETSEGGFALAGGTIVSEGNGYRAWRFWLVKTDENGNMLWNQTYGHANEEAYSLVRTSDGGFALAGTKYIWDPANLGVGNYDFWLVKTDANGVMEWNQTYARTDGDKAHSLIVTSDGGYALAGESYTETFGEGIEHDFWLVKTDGYGNVEWNQTYGGAHREVAYALVETCDGGYALAGYTRSYGAGSTDFWLAKTDEKGFIPEFHPPHICVGSPQNKTYTTDRVSLNFTVNEETSWMSYSLDGQDNVTITETTLNLTELVNCSHYITVYATDMDGNTAASETIRFTVAKEKETEPPPPPATSWTTTAIAIAVAVAAAGAAILLYYTKTKKQNKK